MIRVARIFEDVNGYFICDDSSPCLDARGKVYGSRRAAIVALMSDEHCEYTHYIGADGKLRKV